jgi:hypothetical protein
MSFKKLPKESKGTRFNVQHHKRRWKFTHLEICVRAFCDEHEMLQVLHNRYIICDLEMFPLHKLKASSQQLGFNYLASKRLQHKFTLGSKKHSRTSITASWDNPNVSVWIATK